VPPLPPTADNLSDGFDAFYRGYPKHVGELRARRAWEALAPDAELQRRILGDLAVRRETWDWTKDAGRFVPNPATYLTERRWEDERGPLDPPAPRGGGSKLDRQRASLDTVKRIAGGEA
jgi:hypothetical protein